MKKFQGLLGSVLILCSTMMVCNGKLLESPVIAGESSVRIEAERQEFAMLTKVFGKELQHMTPEQRKHADRYILDLIEKRLKPGSAEEDHLRLLVHKELSTVSEADAIKYVEEKLTPKNKLFTEFALSLKSLGINLDEMRERLDSQEYEKLVELLELRLRNDSKVGPGTSSRKELNVLLQKGGFHGSIPGGQELEKLLNRTQKHTPTPREQLAKSQALEAAAQATVEAHKATIKANEAKALQVDEEKVLEEDPSLKKLLNKPLQPEEQHVLDLVLSEEEQKLLTSEDKRLFINILRKHFGDAQKKGTKLSPAKEATRRLIIEKAAHRNPEAVEIIQELINLLASHQMELQEQVIGGAGYNREGLKKHEEALIAHIEKGKLSEKQRKLLNEYFEELHRYWTKHQPKTQETQQRAAGVVTSTAASSTTMSPTAALIREEMTARQSAATTPSNVSAMPMVPAEPVMPRVSPGLQNIQNEMREFRENKSQNQFLKGDGKELRETPSPEQLAQAVPQKKPVDVVESMAIGKYKIGHDDWPVNTRKGSFGDITAKVKPSFGELKPHDQLETLKVIVGDAHLLSLLTEKDQEWIRDRILELEKPQTPISVPSTSLESSAASNARGGLFSAATSVAAPSSVMTNTNVPSATTIVVATPPTVSTTARPSFFSQSSSNTTSADAGVLAAVAAAETTSSTRPALFGSSATTTVNS